MPGVLKDVPGMLMDPLGPLAIRWSYLPRIAPWLMRFLAASRRGRVEEIAAGLRPLLASAIEAYLPLADEAGAREMIRRTGWLSLYETDESFRKAQWGLELQRRLGVRMEVLRAEEIRQAEPTLAPIYRHGVVHPDNAYVLDPGGSLRGSRKRSRAGAGGSSGGRCSGSPSVRAVPSPGARRMARCPSRRSSSPPAPGRARSPARWAGTCRSTPSAAIM